MKRWFWLIGLFLEVTFLKGQTELRMSEYPSFNKGSLSSVYTMLKGPQDFLWLGGGDGFGRLSITGRVGQYHKADGYITDIESIGGFMFFLSSSRGTLDILSRNGIVKRQVLSRAITTRHMVSSQKNKCIALSFNGMLHLVDSTGNLTTLADTIGWVDELEMFDDKRAFLSARTGCYLFNFSDSTLTRILTDSVENRAITSVAYGKGKTYISIDNQVLELHGRTLVTRHVSPLEKVNKIVNSQVDSFGRLWIAGFKSGLFMLEDGRYENILEKFGLDVNLRVDALYLDNTGKLWIHFFNKGLFTLTDLQKTIYDNIDGLPSWKHEMVQNELGGIFVATDKGLFEIRDDKLLRATITRDSLRFELPTFSSGWQHPRIDALDFYNKPGFGLIATAQFAQVTKPISFKRNGLNYIFASCVYGHWLDSNYFVLSDHESAYHFKIIDGKPQYCQVPEGLQFPRIGHLRDKGGMSWYSRYGSFLGAGRNGEVELKDLRFIPADLRATLSSGIGEIFQDSKGVIWVAAYRGLASCSNGIWKTYGAKNGLTYLNATCVAEDDQGMLWFGSKGGLFSYDREKDTFINCVNSLGLNSLGISEILFDETEDKFYVSDGDGVEVIEREKLKFIEVVVPTPSILELEDINVRSHYSPKNVSLPKTSRNFRIHFESPYYKDPEKIVYEYSDQSANGPWFSTADNKVEQMTASYGKHEFHVRAKVGDATSKVSSLYYTIETPFFLRTWVQVAGVFLVILIVILLALQRIKNVKQRESKERNMLLQLKVLEQQALGAMMNPHFVYNSLASIQNYFTRTNNLQASEHVAELGQLIRMNMDAASGSFIRLSVELDRLKLYLKLEQQRMAQPFEFDVRVDSKVEMHRYFVPSMVIQPFLENALIHGIWPLENKKGQIEMAITLGAKETIQVTILDNGIGFTNSQKKKSSQRISRGLQITRDRLGLLEYVEGDSITVEDRVSENGEIIGTKATLILPLKREDEMTDTN